MANLPPAAWLAEIDFVAFQDKRELARLKAKVDIEPLDLGDEDVAALVAFLKSLTGTQSIKGRLGRPESVPSGLKVD